MQSLNQGCSLAITKSSLLVLLSILQITVAAEPSHPQTTNDTLLWGPYRPNVYFGVRPRLPNSIFTGLIWSNVDTDSLSQACKLPQRKISVPKIRASHTCMTAFRHTCEQDEGMAGYGWDEYDIGTGGRQTIHDEGSNIDITTEFAKVAGGDHGGNWGARIKGALRDGALETTSTTVAFYVGTEGLGPLQLNNEYDKLGYQGDIQLMGTSPGLGGFKIEITKGPSTNRHPHVEHAAAPDRPLDRTMIQSLQVPQEALWKSKRRCAYFYSSSMALLTFDAASLQRSSYSKCLKR